MKVASKLFALSVSAVLLLSAATSFAKLSPREIYKNMAPAVVLIVASQEGSSSASAGTGSIIKSDGTVVTNCHVIYDENAKKPFPVIHIFLKPDRVSGDMEKDLTKHFVGKMISYDRDLDLALLKIDSPPSGLPVITLGDPEEVGPGDETVAIGHPEQGGLWTITTGVIGTEFDNFKGIAGKDVFQMETSLNRGNSGGPLFDIRGYQIGVNTAIARKGEGGVAITGVNFALKASVVKKWAGKNSVLIAYGSEKVDSPSNTQVAVAEKRPPETPTKTEPATPKNTGDNQASIKVEPGYGEVDNSGENAGQASPQATEVKRPIVQKHKKPVKFAEKYSEPSRPYKMEKLYSAVDKVRARAKEAFDDLDREAQRHGGH
jgi:serine protease Do